MFDCPRSFKGPAISLSQFRRNISGPKQHALSIEIAQLLFLFNLFWSMYRGKKAEENPWQATTLEWTIPSPPPFDNFGGRHPVVYRGAYEFGVEGTKDDYVMQDSPGQSARS